ncbi:MAG: hypothetical protein ACFWT3_08200 [Pseudomonas lundensis]
MARQAAPTETGVLRVTTPVPLAVRYLAPVIAAFRERHPRQCFDLQLSDRVVDLHGGDIDLADSRRILVEPPDDLRRAGAPSYPRELHQHPCLLFAHSGLRMNRWTVKHSCRGGRNEVMDVMGICAATMAMLCGHGAYPGWGFCCARPRTSRTNCAAAHSCASCATRSIFGSALLLISWPNNGWRRRGMRDSDGWNQRWAAACAK